MTIVNHTDIPKANGHYSTAIISNKTLYVSGQLPISTDGTHHNDSPFDEQFAIVFGNIKTILKASGSDLNKVVKVNVYISDVALWPQFNALYAAYMGNHKPVRTVVPVAALHYNYQLEVDLIAEV